MIDKIQQKIQISAAHSNERLDQALAKLMPHFSRTQLQEWIKKGSILLDGHQTKSKVKLKGNEIIEVNVELAAQGDWEAQSIPLDIAYEDKSLLVINKPAHFVVHPGAGNADRTLLNALLHYAPDLRLLPRAGIVHRIDKDTSGLLVVAKTNPALKNLQQQLKQRTIVREYKAVVQGTIISGSTIDAPISRHPHNRKRMSINPKGRLAVTHFRVIKKYRVHTLLKLRLETGRTHQIRVHMAHVHHPIVGDPVYGGRLRLAKNMPQKVISCLQGFKRQALHAFALTFKHPENDEIMHLEADLPKDMQLLLKALSEDLSENESR